LASIQEIPLTTIAGEPETLASYAGQVLLVVNVASKCGLTPQYEALEKLYERFRGDGFTVLGFPANDFLGQEPGTDSEIAEFCSTTFDVQFPLFSKLVVTGEDKHPLYGELISSAVPVEGDKEAFRSNLRGHGIAVTDDPEVVWNFEKFLISRTGEVVARFAPDVAPDDPRLVQAVERELAAG
jgi:glutathione peroxidase